MSETTSTDCPVTRLFTDAGCDMEAPGRGFIGDGSIQGSEVYYSERRGGFVVCDFDRGTVSVRRGLALVSLAGEADAGDGLNQACLGCDLETPAGLWLIDLADLGPLAADYGELLNVLAVTDKEEAALELADIDGEDE